jgi:adenylate kinase
VKPHVIAFTGLSGVGKSTLLQKLSAHWRFQHLQASALIRATRQATEIVPTVDHLRLADLDENQQLLVRGFAAAADKNEPLIVLDAHTLIELPNGTVLIEPEVFGAIGIKSMLFLTAPAADIASRRANDRARQRQHRTAEDLEKVLEEARRQAEHICHALRVPLFVVESSDDEAAAKVLAASGAAPR